MVGLEPMANMEVRVEEILLALEATLVMSLFEAVFTEAAEAPEDEAGREWVLGVGEVVRLDFFIITQSSSEKITLIHSCWNANSIYFNL